MQCRRWWIAASVMVLVVIGAGGLRTAHAADVTQLVKDLDALHGKEAVDKKDEIVAPAKTMGPEDKNKYAVKVGEAIEAQKLLESKNVEAQLNAIITIVELDALNTDGFLKRALKNPNPSVRYWAAKGLGQIMDRLLRAGAAAGSIQALQNQLKVETSGIVKTEIVKAIAASGAASGDIKEILAALQQLAADLQKNAPDTGTIDAAKTAVEAVRKLIDTPPAGAAPIAKADATAAAAAAAHAASYAAQQNVALNKANVLPDGNNAAAVDLAKSAVDLVNTVGKLRLAPPKATDGPDELLFEVNALTGSKTLGGGEIQKTMPEIPVPGAVNPK